MRRKRATKSLNLNPAIVYEELMINGRCIPISSEKGSLLAPVLPMPFLRSRRNRRRQLSFSG